MHSETIALSPERDRLEQRVRRVELVIASLRDRAVYRGSGMGVTPVPLRLAIADFESQLTQMRGRLDELRQLDQAPSAEPTRPLASACAAGGEPSLRTRARDQLRFGAARSVNAAVAGAERRSAAFVAVTVRR